MTTMENVQPYISHLSLLVALGAVTVLLPRNRMNAPLHRVTIGFVFGAVAIVGMLNPVPAAPGIFFDGRSVVISLCGLFYGPLPTTIAATMAMGFRISQGGDGQLMGCAVIFSAALLGILFRRRHPPEHTPWTTPRFMGFGVLVHVVLLLCLTLLLIQVPPGDVLEIFEQIAVPILLLYPATTVILGRILQDQLVQADLLESTIRSEEHLRDVITHAPIAMALSRRDGKIAFRNHHFLELLGYSQDEVGSVEDWMQRAYPDPVYRKEAHDIWMAGVALAHAKRTAIPEREYQVTNKWGKHLHVEISGIMLGDETLVLFKDVTERKSAESENLHLRRLYAMLSQTNKLITHAPDRMTLLEGVCNIAIDYGGFRFVWFGEPDGDGKIVPVAKAGEDHGYIDSIRATIHADDPRGQGPAGRVIRSGEPVITNNFVAAVATTPWHEFAQRINIAASAGFPIFQQGSIVGVINLYASEVDFFGREEIATLEEIVSDVSYALDNLAREAERARAVADVQTLSVRLSHYLAVSPVVSYMLRVENGRNKAEWVSENIVKLLGFSMEEVMADGWWECHVHPDDRDAALAAMTNHVAGEVVHHEYRFFRENGVALWILDSYRIAQNDDDGTARIFGAWTDITERKANEEHLRLQSAALDAAANGIVVTDLQGDIVWVNSAFSMLTQYPYSDVIGRNPRELVKSGVHEDQFYEDMWNTILTGKVWRGNITNRRKDGTFYTEEQAITPIRDAAGNITHFVGVKEDVTDRVHTEFALRKSQERLQRALVIGKIALWEWDIADDSVYYSPEWALLVGAPHFGESGTLAEWLDRIHPDDLMLLKRDLSRDRALAKSSWERQFRLRDDSGEYRWILMNASCEYDSEGKPIRLIGTNVDISERKRLEHEFEQAQKLESIGRLAGGIAHDFNNLLNVIFGYTEMAMAAVPEGEDLYKDLQQILRASDRAANLTRQLLAFSRRQVLSPEVLNINKIITDADKMLRRLIGEDIDLHLDLASDLGQTMADHGQIEQVLLNLAVNARDAMPGGGVISIATHNTTLDAAHTGFSCEPGPYIRISVCDSGTGMPESVREKIFEPFFTTKEHGKGTGLGLATVYGIVKQSEGSINVISEPGAGTTIEIFLPRIDVVVAPEAPQEIPASQTGHETILLVEDELDLLLLARRCIEQAGYQVLCAKNGPEALDLFENSTEKIDLLLTDVIMPGMSGPVLANHLVEKCPTLRVLYMSGYTDDSLAHHGVLDPGVTLLLKPFSAVQLTAKIREVLDDPHHQSP